MAIWNRYEWKMDVTRDRDQQGSHGLTYVPLKKRIIMRHYLDQAVLWPGWLRGTRHDLCSASPVWAAAVIADNFSWFSQLSWFWWRPFLVTKTRQISTEISTVLPIYTVTATEFAKWCKPCVQNLETVLQTGCRLAKWNAAVQFDSISYSNL